MKHLTFLVAAALSVFATNSFAQNNKDLSGEYTRIFSIGPVVGFGHTGMRGVPGDDMFKPSWSGGVTMNYSNMAHVGFSADVLYSMEGARVEDADGYENDLTLHYLRVPLKFAYFFGDFKNKFRPKVTIGPSLGFLVDENMNREYVPAGEETNPNGSAIENYQSFDIGGQLSVGFNAQLGENMWLNTDIYWYHGFLGVDIADHENSNVGLRVGLAFGL